MNTLQELEAAQVARLVANRPVPPFQPGDTVRVSLRVVEGERERIQAFEGVCIARKNAGLHSSFTVRKISYGEGVERVFPLYSPRIAGVELVRRGQVRRAKLYYLRGRRGKSARIAERTDRQGVGRCRSGRGLTPTLVLSLSKDDDELLAEAKPCQSRALCSTRSGTTTWCIARMTAPA